MLASDYPFLTLVMPTIGWDNTFCGRVPFRGVKLEARMP